MGRIAVVTARKLRRDETEVARADDEEVDGIALIRNVWKESDPMRGGKQIRQAARNHHGTVENILGVLGSF